MPIHKQDTKRFFILLLATLSFLPAFSSFISAPKAAAAVEVKDLVQLAEKCHDIEKNSDLWTACENFQNYSQIAVGCSSTMFYSVEKQGKTLWFLTAQKYLDCVNKTQATFDYVKSDKCASMQHGNGPDSQSWKECESRQYKLYQLAGCSQFMFKPRTDKPGFYTQATGALTDCQTKLVFAKIASIHAPDGTTAPPDSAPPPPTGADGGGAAGSADVDCSTSLSSQLSWIACPIIDMGSAFTDFVFKDFIRPMLETVPISTNPSDGGYKAWQGFRLLGNLLLVGTLLAIVYGQARGGGGGR